MKGIQKKEIIVKKKFKIKTPPNSPDLNPIEWVWADLKKFVSKKLCKTEQECISAIEEFKKTLTETKCKRYIKKLHSVGKNI